MKVAQVTGDDVDFIAQTERTIVQQRVARRVGADVEDGDIGTHLDQRFGHVTADEPKATGDEGVLPLVVRCNSPGLLVRSLLGQHSRQRLSPKFV